MLELVDNWVIFNAGAKWTAALSSVEEESCKEATTFVDVVSGLQRCNFGHSQNRFSSSIVVACGFLE